MTKTTRNTISEPHLIELEQYRLMATQPPGSIELLARFLTKLRVHAASQAANDPQVRQGIMRYAASTALMLAAIRARNKNELETKVSAIHGVQFLDSDFDTARAVQMLMRADAKRAGEPIDSMAVHTPDPTKLNS